MGVELKAPSSAVMIRSGLSGANLRNSFARVYAARPLPTITTLLIRFPPKKYGPIARRALLRHFDERLRRQLDHLEVGLDHAAIRTFPIVRNRRPSRTWRDAVFRHADFFIVNETAHHTLPFFHYMLLI